MRDDRRLKGVRHQQLATTDLEERGPSGDVLQATRADTASPLSLCNPQLSVTDHRGGGEGVGVAATRAITGLRGGGGWGWRMTGSGGQDAGGDGSGGVREEMETVRMC